MSTASVTRPESTLHPVALAAISPGMVRCLLAFTVVIYHMSSIGLGTWAVDVFFVLSGFWVTVMYRRKYLRYQLPPLAFYVSRYMRLFPIFLLCQTVLILCLFWRHSPMTSVVTLEWILRCLPIVGSAHQQVLLVPSWSLDVEAQFYLLLPLLILLLNRLPDVTAARVALAASIMLLPLELFATTASDWLYPFSSFFLIGIAQAYRPWRPTARTAMISLAGFAGATFLVAALHQTRGLLLGGRHPYDPALYVRNPQLCAALTVIILPAVLYSLSIRSTPLDRRLGNMAYPMYLVHWIVPALLATVMQRMSPVSSRLLDIAMVLLASFALEMLVDQPAERFRERFMKRRFVLAPLAKSAV